MTKSNLLRLLFALLFASACAPTQKSDTKSLNAQNRYELCLSEKAPAYSFENEAESDDDSFIKFLDDIDPAIEPCKEKHLSVEIATQPTVRDSMSLANPKQVVQATRIVLTAINKTRAKLTFFNGKKIVATRFVNTVPAIKDAPATGKVQYLFGKPSDSEVLQVQGWRKDLKELKAKKGWSSSDSETLDDADDIVQGILQYTALSRKKVRVVKDPTGKVQAASAMEIGQKKTCMNVHYIVTRPANLSLSQPVSGRVGGAGTALLRESLREHIKEGGRACIKLIAFEGAVVFYKKLGFKARRLDHMELEEDAALKFLNAGL